MKDPIQRSLVCRFTLPASANFGDIAAWLTQMLRMHAGQMIDVSIETEPCELGNDQTLRVLSGDAELLREVVATNAPDWHSAGLRRDCAA